MVFTASYQSLGLLNPCYYCLRADYAIFLQLFCIFLKKGIDITENRSKMFSRCRVYPLSLNCLVQRRERGRAKVSPTLYIGLYICSFIKNRRLRLRVSAGRDYFRSGYDWLTVLRVAPLAELRAQTTAGGSGGLRTSHLTRFRAAKRAGCTGMQSESGFFKALAKIAEGWNTKKQWKTAGSKFSFRNWISRSEKYILYFFCENDADTCCFLYPNGNLGQKSRLGKSQAVLIYMTIFLRTGKFYRYRYSVL